MAYTYNNPINSASTYNGSQTIGYNSNNFLQPGQVQQSVPSVVYVNGEEGANNYPVAAGNTMLLMDFNSNQFWLKSTLPNGVTQPMRTFSFEEKTPRMEVFGPGDYVTKKEFNDLKSYLDNQFNSLRRQSYGPKNKNKEDNRND